VINDVRTTAAWDAIRSKLPENNQSILSRIIVTTPTETVAKELIYPDDDSVNGHYYTYCMKPLRLQDDRHQQFIGVKKQVDSLAKKLKEAGDGQMGVFSIVGFGGVGKTTLAMEVCRQLEEDFPFQAMVSVSQAFEPTRDLKPLLKRMLEQVVKRRTENERGIKEDIDVGSLNDNELGTKLEETLKDKRYVRTTTKGMSNNTSYVAS
jgi:hypothetical protein